MSQDNQSAQDRIAEAERQLAETQRRISQSSVGSSRTQRNAHRPSTSVSDRYSQLGKRPDVPNLYGSTSGAEASSGATPTGVASGSSPAATRSAARSSDFDPSKSAEPLDADMQRAIEESKRSPRSSKSSAVSDTDAELQRAIAASRETAERESVRGRPGNMEEIIQGRPTTRGTGSMASGRTSGSFDGLLANMTEAQRSLLDELVEINGQDSYDSLTAGIGKLKKDEFLVLPEGFAIPNVRPVDVGKPIAHSSISLTEWADIYALNKAMAPAGSDAMTFGLLRLEAVKCGWVKDLREVRFGTPPNDAMLILTNDMATLRERASDIKTASFIIPFAAEHTFRTMGHHFISSDQANYVRRYSDTLRACLYPQVANLLPPAVLYHTALHWIGPGRVRDVLMAQLETQSIPDAIRIRANAAPAGTAILTTTAAIIDAMATVGLDAAFDKYGNFNLSHILAITARVKTSPCKYHKAYFAYGISKASNGELAELETGKRLAEKFAPYAQAFIDTYMREAALGRARAIKKHADNNPIQLRRAQTLFRSIVRERVTSVEDLIKTQLGAVSGDDYEVV